MRTTFLPVLVAVFFPLLVSATSIVPYEYLSQLVQASDAVVAVRATQAYETDAPDCTHYDCDFQVLVTLKGPLPVDTTFFLRQHSFRDAMGWFNVAGDFEPTEEKVYLIFLDSFQGGWRPMMLSYYIFEEVFTDGQYFWAPVKESLAMSVMPLPNGREAESLAVYKRDELLQLIREHVANPTKAWNPTAALTTLPLTTAAQDRALPPGCDFDMGGIGLSRWLNTTINVYYDATGAPADAAARISSTLTYLMSNYPGLTLVPAGPADFTPDCSDNSVAGQDFINFSNSSLSGQQSILIMFEDPCNQIPALNNCAGTLGLGGSYSLSSTHQYKGDTWKNAAWGYLVVNNGVRACQSETNFDRFLAHELTHAFKMDHLDPTLYPGNNMNPLCCNPISAKDQECMNYVYESALPPLPVSLTAFSATAEKDHVVVRWSTAQEVNNSHYFLEKSPDGLRFEPLATVMASKTTNQPNQYEIVDALPFPGNNYYRLVQVDYDGTNSNLGVATARFDGRAGGYAVLPNPVYDGRLQLVARSGQLRIESLELVDPAGRSTLLETAPDNSAADRLDLHLNSLPNGVYWLKVRALEGEEVVKFVKM